jgi:hypothetical protein
MTKLSDITIEHLGADAGIVDLVQFTAWVREMVERRPDLSEDEAVDTLWGTGDYRKNARLLGLSGTADTIEQGRVYLLRGREPELIAYPAHADTQEFATADDAEGWVLYTRQEWETESPADLEIDADGRILFQGKPTGDTAADLVFTGHYQS